MIKKLPEEMISLISAGEVIQSPLALLKELIENSLDAKATKISISIYKKTKEIQIKDNGIGISPEDVKNVCKRHFTSKFGIILENSQSDEHNHSLNALINSDDGLRNLTTYGFRGEALCSISLLCDLRLKTKQQNHQAIEAVFKGENLIKETTIQQNTTGTTFFITNLAKFEENNLNIKEFINLLKSFKLFWLDVEFDLIVDGKNLLNSFCVGSRAQRQINILQSLTWSNSSSKNIIGKINNNRGDRDQRTDLHVFESDSFNFIFSKGSSSISKPICHFICFVNKRLVSFKKLKKRIEDVYLKKTKVRNAFVFYIEIFKELNKVDVNVHPSKMEVLVENEDVFIEEVAMCLREQLTEVDSFLVVTKETIRNSNDTSKKNASKSQNRNSNIQVNKTKTLEEYDIELQNTSSPKNFEKKIYESPTQKTLNFLHRAKHCSETRFKNENTSQNTLKENIQKSIIVNTIIKAVKRPIFFESLRDIKTDLLLNTFESIEIKLIKLVPVGSDGNNLFFQNGSSLVSVDFRGVLRKFLFSFFLNEFGNYDCVLLKNIFVENWAGDITNEIVIFDSIDSRLLALIKDYFKIDISFDSEDSRSTYDSKEDMEANNRIDSRSEKDNKYKGAIEIKSLLVCKALALNSAQPSCPLNQFTLAETLPEFIRKLLLIKMTNEKEVFFSILSLLTECFSKELILLTSSLKEDISSVSRFDLAMPDTLQNNSVEMYLVLRIAKLQKGVCFDEFFECLTDLKKLYSRFGR
ncbi:DNA mismatch repair protein MutL [Cucumispora dikerogammari]|nr:DNA mismatch repair protein MutL [Cucumispora dikerogammari]